MNKSAPTAYVVVKHVFEEYFGGGIEILGAYSDKTEAVERMLTEADKTLRFINENVGLYPFGIRLFGSEDYWTACVKENGMTKNIVEIFVTETEQHIHPTEKEGRQVLHL
jgi:hypothetical protein